MSSPRTTHQQYSTTRRFLQMQSILIDKTQAEYLMDMINNYHDAFNDDGREIVAVLEYILATSGILEK